MVHSALHDMSFQLLFRCLMVFVAILFCCLEGYKVTIFFTRMAILGYMLLSSNIIQIIDLKYRILLGNAPIMSSTRRIVVHEFQNLVFER